MTDQPSTDAATTDVVTAASGGGGPVRGTIRVAVHGDRIDADIAVALRGGVPIAKVTDAIQAQVARAVERMLGMTAASVNIYIDTIGGA